MAKSRKAVVKPDLVDEADAGIDVATAAEVDIAGEEVAAEEEEEVEGDDEVPDDDLDEEVEEDPDDSIPEIIAPTIALLGPPALLEGEDEEAYYEFLARVTETVKPADVLEELWVRDFADQAWDVLRYRRLKAELIAANMHLGLNQVLTRICGPGDASMLVASWKKKDQKTLEAIEELLEATEISMDQVHAVTLSMIIEYVERIEHLITQAEAHRNGVLKEVDRHRHALGQNLRLANDSVVDGECREVNPKRIGKAVI